MARTHYATLQKKEKAAAAASQAANKGISLPAVAVVQRAMGSIKNDELQGRSDKARKLGIDKTRVSFTTDTLSTTRETVGTKMVADPIGPDHPMGAQPNQKAAAKHIANANQNTSDTFIRGHLLNGNIGGPGSEQNLFPITKQANSRHYQEIEKHVESWVNNSKYYVRYEVEVKNRDDVNHEAEFHCKAYLIDKKGDITGNGITAVIKSSPGNTSSQSRNVNSRNTKGAQVDKLLTDKDIEYQKGRFAEGYKTIDPSIMDIMEVDNKVMVSGRTQLERKLDKILPHDNAVQTVVDAYITGDPAIAETINKSTWNRWMDKIGLDYK